MADAPVSSGGQSGANLAEIRRAGERARQLVDQILTFGRRGEGRREHVCLKVLVAETNGLLAASLPPHVGIKVNETSEAALVFGRTCTIAVGHPEYLQQCCASYG
jgi:hypothetical protein